MGWLPECLCDTRAHKRNNSGNNRKLGNATTCNVRLASGVPSKAPKFRWLQAPVTAYTDPSRPGPTYTNLARVREISTDYAQLLGPYTQAESRKGRNAVRETHAAPLSTEGGCPSHLEVDPQRSPSPRRHPEF
ncbi:hypothetical protein B0H13DRAFT_1903879 [Mycena leptocephala]|nr:hypothetical protein B0H13DRAFT_1903879 [Mycena leptocephala]